MTKVNTYISTAGEVFEGTQVQLMKEYGIKNRTAFSRPTGAPGDDGERWMEEGKLDALGGFQKKKLYLYERSIKEKGPDGKIQTVIQCPSETGSWMCWAIEEKDPSDELKAAMRTVELTYDVINNKKVANTANTWGERIEQAQEVVEELYEMLTGYDESVSKFYAIRSSVRDAEAEVRWLNGQRDNRGDEYIKFLHSDYSVLDSRELVRLRKVVAFINKGEEVPSFMDDSKHNLPEKFYAFI